MSISSGRTVEHRAVKRETVTNGSFTTPALSVFAKATPSGFAQSTSTYVDVSYEILPYPKLIDLQTPVSYHKGPNGIRTLNKPLADQTSIQDRAISIVWSSTYPGIVFHTLFPYNIVADKAFFPHGNYIHKFSHSGPHTVASNFNIPSIAMGKNGVGDGPTMSRTVFSGAFNQQSTYKVAIEPDATRNPNDGQIEAQAIVRWHYPYENLTELFRVRHYLQSSIVSTEFPHYATYGNNLDWVVTIYPLREVQLIGGVAVLGNVISNVPQHPLSSLALFAFSFALNEINQGLILETPVDFETAWNNTVATEVPASTFEPNRANPKTEYIMYPIPWEGLDAVAMQGDHYDHEGFLGSFESAIGGHITEVRKVGRFVHFDELDGGGGSDNGDTGTGVGGGR